VGLSLVLLIAAGLHVRALMKIASWTISATTRGRLSSSAADCDLSPVSRPSLPIRPAWRRRGPSEAVRSIVRCSPPPAQFRARLASAFWTCCR
jgi:hypothetical protein